MLLLCWVHGPVELSSELLPLVHMDIIKDILVHDVRLCEDTPTRTDTQTHTLKKCLELVHSLNPPHQRTSLCWLTAVTPPLNPAHGRLNRTQCSDTLEVSGPTPQVLVCRSPAGLFAASVWTDRPSLPRCHTPACLRGEGVG